MKKLPLIGLILVCIFAPLAYLVVNYVHDYYKETTRDELSILTELSKAAVNAESLQKLPGTDMDLGSEDYLKLREQFKTMGEPLKKMGIYGIYVTKQLDNDIVFIVDSAPQNDTWHSDIGVKYEDPPEELRRVFVDGKTLTTDKYTDEYGTFFSTFVPIFEGNSTNIIGVFGADIDYTDFIKRTNNQTKIIVYIVVLLIALILIVYFLINRINQSRKNQEKYNKELELINKNLEEKVKERTVELQHANGSLEEKVKERTAEIQNKISELERVNSLMIDRELKMVGMKNEIETLKKKLGA